MIVAAWAKGKDGPFSFPDGSGHCVRFEGKVMGGVWTTKKSARDAYRAMVKAKKEARDVRGA